MGSYHMLFADLYEMICRTACICLLSSLWASIHSKECNIGTNSLVGKLETWKKWTNLFAATGGPSKLGEGKLPRRLPYLSCGWQFVVVLVLREPNSMNFAENREKYVLFQFYAENILSVLGWWMVIMPLSWHLNTGQTWGRVKNNSLKKKICISSAYDVWTGMGRSGLALSFFPRGFCIQSRPGHLN